MFIEYLLCVKYFLCILLFKFISIFSNYWMFDVIEGVFGIVSFIYNFEFFYYDGIEVLII